MNHVRVLALAAAGALGVAILTGSIASAEPVRSTPSVAVNSIEVARTLPIGTAVTVEGIATTASGIFESSFYDKGFGLQRGNSGIYVSDPENSGIAVGDQVQVVGILADQEGLLVVRPTTVVRIGAGAQIRPSRLPLNAIGEGSEGRLVTVSGIVSGPVVDDLPYGHKIPVSGTSGNTVIFVNTQTGIDVASIAVGRSIAVTGFSGQYADTYEVLPSSEADVQQGFTGSLTFGS
ncbi:hypothetical protein [Rhodococcus sp. IEGM 1379]|uniref:hypothetical protein n=1 Tax=Rhodococcus sp. IEGM 1379 TaxID=3047086 RepID=UPI0024B6D4E4|nr:hypothetical protein [Rhodococcus sp. IEGM 1379]MDI9918903.1 hypothetical protein [Rhodococcus sp. IEGM 1379]